MTDLVERLRKRTCSGTVERPNNLGPLTEVLSDRECWEAAEAIERLELENSQIRDRWAKMGQQLAEARAENKRLKKLLKEHQQEFCTENCSKAGGHFEECNEMRSACEGDLAATEPESRIGGGGYAESLVGCAPTTEREAERRVTNGHIVCCECGQRTEVHFPILLPAQGRISCGYCGSPFLKLAAQQQALESGDG